jgi:hypothetical protein
MGWVGAHLVVQQRHQHHVEVLVQLEYLDGGIERGYREGLT